MMNTLKITESENINVLHDKIIIVDKNDIRNEIDGYECVLSEKIDKNYIKIYAKIGIQEDVSIIIQGKYDVNILLQNIKNACKYGKIILSLWGMEGLDEQITKNYIKENRIENGQNIYMQVCSTSYGIGKSDTKYTIKMRGDEYYYNLDKMIFKMKENHDKVITSNIFFRKIKTFPFHISDHIIGGKTENMMKMFTKCKKYLEEKRNLPLVKKDIPEQWLTVSYLLEFYNKIQLTRNNAREIMLKHFDIIELTEFEDFIVSYNRKKVYGPLELKNHKIIDIRSISEI